jgi:hypothetical protein
MASANTFEKSLLISSRLYPGVSMLLKFEEKTSCRLIATSSITLDPS